MAWPEELSVFEAWRASSLSRALSAKFVESHPDESHAYVAAREFFLKEMLDRDGANESTRTAIQRPVTDFAALEGAGWLDIRACFSPCSRLYLGGIEDQDAAQVRWASADIRAQTNWTQSLRSAVGV